MSIWQSRPVLRWIVPITAAVSILGAGAAIHAIAAGANPVLAPRDAAQLLVDLQTARLDALSGTVVERADLGLPSLPALTGAAGGSGSTDLTALLSGTHTLRLWYSGPDSARVALLGTLGETDVITHGTDMWTWDSRANQATHRTLPARQPGARAAGGGPGAGADQPSPFPLHPDGSALTPQRLADAALAAIDPTTVVTTAGSARVAGRDAYELVLAPRDTASLVSSVRIAIDASRHLPLRVQVYARGHADPSVEVGFTSISFTRPDPAQFVFNPPPGATVVDRDTTATPGTPAGPGKGARPGYAVIGQGWTSVVVLRLPAGGLPGLTSGRPGGLAQKPGSGAGAASGSGTGPSGGHGTPGDLGSLLRHLPMVSGAWGSGHLLAGTLFSVLITDDGRILVGAVTPDRLTAAAADPAARLGS
jgi:outer membrane lipoprotein-sorting protein